MYPNRVRQNILLDKLRKMNMGQDDSIDPPMQYTDFPFDEVCEKAKELINSAPGKIDVYQKFTCSGCGQRLTMGEPNHFYETGSCDKCPAITNIKEQGCNMMVHARAK